MKDDFPHDRSDLFEGIHTALAREDPQVAEQFIEIASASVPPLANGDQPEQPVKLVIQVLKSIWGENYRKKFHALLEKMVENDSTNQHRALVTD